jgi:hypothetical protein
MGPPVVVVVDPVAALLGLWRVVRLGELYELRLSAALTTAELMC